MRALAIIGVLPAVLFAQPAAEGGWRQQLEQTSRAYRALAEHVDPAVVQIVTSGYAPASDNTPSLLRARRGTGAGVFVDPSGYIVTNAHVVGEVRRVQVLVPRTGNGATLKPAGRLLPAKVIGSDRETDIAVLKVEGEKFPYLPFGDSSQLGPGQVVFAFGSPYGLDNSVTMGIISSVARQVRAEDPMIYIQTDAAINPGNSGGPLVDASGTIVGINTFIVSPSGGNDGVGFAAPSNIARNVYEQIREHGRVRRGQIGVMTETITPPLVEALGLPADSGVLISDVIPGGAAESAGLRINDIVTAVNGKPVESARDLGLDIYASAGRELALDVLRGTDKHSITVAVLERSKDPDRILSLVTGDQNVIAQLGIVAVELDERVTPLLPTPRKLSGVVVAGVIAQITPHEDGLHSGDIIYAVNGLPVNGLAQLRDALAKIRHGQTIAVHIERGNRLQYLMISAE